MHIYDSFNGLELFLNFINLDVLGSGFHDDVVAVFGDWPGGTNDDE